GSQKQKKDTQRHNGKYLTAGGCERFETLSMASGKSGSGHRIQPEPFCSSEQTLQFNFLQWFRQYKPAIAFEIGRQLRVVTIVEEDKGAHPRLQPLGEFHPVQSRTVDGA